MEGVDVTLVVRKDTKKSEADAQVDAVIDNARDLKNAGEKGASGSATSATATPSLTAKKKDPRKDHPKRARSDITASEKRVSKRR